MREGLRFGWWSFLPNFAKILHLYLIQVMRLEITVWGFLGHTMLFVKIASGTAVALCLSYLTLIKATESTGCCCQIQLFIHKPWCELLNPTLDDAARAPLGTVPVMSPILYLPCALCVEHFSCGSSAPATDPWHPGSSAGCWAGQSRQAQRIHRHNILHSTLAI